MPTRLPAASAFSARGPRCGAVFTAVAVMAAAYDNGQPAGPPGGTGPIGSALACTHG